MDDGSVGVNVKPKTTKCHACLKEFMLAEILRGDGYCEECAGYWDEYLDGWRKKEDE